VTVRIAKPIAIGRYEVTFDEWDLCHDQGGCERDPYDRKWGRGRRPVFNVRHGEAKEFAAWLTKKTGKAYRLPTEAEWEYAARAGTTTAYFWGDDIGEGHANCRRCGSEWGGLKSAPVGSFAPNPWGLFDMNGNLFEYVEDCWHPDHLNQPPDGAARVEPGCARRVIKGGAWYFLPKVSRAAARAANDVRVFGYFIGFRVAREIADGEEFRPVPTKSMSAYSAARRSAAAAASASACILAPR
jgi:formylglycine-generating enzyme required for sulfatase activity